MRAKKLFFNPKIIIPLTFLVLVNITVGITAYIYADKNEQLSYTLAFKHLEAINNIKEHKLKLFFNHRLKDINTLAYDQSILELSQGIINKKNDFYISVFINQYDYSDLLLLDPYNSKIVFSAKNNSLVNQYINSDTFNNSNINKLYKNVLDTYKTHISDTEFSVFDKKDPYLLFATPIKKDNELLKILVLVMPVNVIDDIIFFRTGMENTAESYMVGSDHLLRSNSYLKKTFNLKNSFAEPQKYKIETKAVKEALAGKSSHEIIKDYRNVDVLSVYKPFIFDTIHWALISEIDESELIQHYTNIRYDIMFWSILISLFITIVGYLIIMKILKVSVLTPLQKSYKRAKGFEEIIHNSLNEIYIFDPQTLKFTYINSSAIENCGYSYEEFLNMTPLDIKPRFDADLFAQVIKPLRKKELGQIYFETKHRRKDGSLYDVEIQLQLMHIDNQDRFVAFIQDITKRNKAIQEKEKFYNIATHDYLTKIYNRQMFDDIYKREFNTFVRYKTPLSLILFDIDDFKKINDEYGHDVGDKVLRKLVKIVEKNVRESDIFARWGGEEFVILMKETTLDVAYKKAQHICKEVGKHTFEGVGHVTCSFGVAAPSDEKHPMSIFKDADKALYKAKENGKNRVEKSS
ncbi:sensor domain-containing diguanylate cyclase [Sulfurimonas sp. C5]|uniref:sensor domain-containing diguanylate cyclase n=1 Tax=Sulfurimonas sp. C5 TaxID=3036947 RepID=UPI0024555225|nr:sensor domain-containing diguanylate cyclase [Sulfurimonas sp. C5]MDH4945309.1 sensor domain-containing diguanylate cyclase [Sulfurimonas sp. C5]